MSSLALEELGLRRVGAVIVAFPLTSAEEQPMDAMKAVWKVGTRTHTHTHHSFTFSPPLPPSPFQFMEQLVRDDITNTISTADLMKPQLEELYHWAEVSSCHMPSQPTAPREETDSNMCFYGCFLLSSFFHFSLFLRRSNQLLTSSTLLTAALSPR